MGDMGDNGQMVSLSSASAEEKKEGDGLSHLLHQAPASAF